MIKPAAPPDASQWVASASQVVEVYLPQVIQPPRRTALYISLGMMVPPTSIAIALCLTVLYVGGIPALLGLGLADTFIVVVPFLVATNNV